MTEKGKEAVRILNRLKCFDEITEDEYFLLLDFVVGQDNLLRIPSYPTYPLITWDTKPIPVTCDADNINVAGDLTPRNLTKDKTNENVGFATQERVVRND